MAHRMVKLAVQCECTRFTCSVLLLTATAEFARQSSKSKHIVLARYTTTLTSSIQSPFSETMTPIQNSFYAFGASHNVVDGDCIGRKKVHECVHHSIIFIYFGIRIDLTIELWRLWGNHWIGRGLVFWQVLS